MAFGAKISLSVNTSGASKFRKEIQDYVNNATAKNPIYVTNLKITEDAKENLAKELRSYLREDRGIVVKINRIDTSGAVSKLRKDLETMLSGLQIGGLKEFLGTDGVENTYAKAAERAEKLAEATEKVRKKSVDASAALQELKNAQSALTGSYTNISKTKSADVSSLLGEYEELNRKIQELRSNESLRTDEAISQISREAIALRQKTAAILENERKSEASGKKELALSKRILSVRTQVQTWINKNGKAYKLYRSDIDAIMLKLQNESALSEEALGAIEVEFKRINGEMHKAGIAGNDFFETIKAGWKKFSTWSVTTRSMMGVYRIVKDMYSAVKDVDKAMTELRKVTDLTTEQYERCLNASVATAKRIGATVSDTVNATADFARLGYDVDESAKFAEAALIYKNVGDGIDNISEASESLISTIKAFGGEAKDAMGIVDKFNEVGNNFAISSSGIGVALQKSASSLSAANNTLEESIALITGMNSVIQNPEVVGTSLKTVSMYLRAAKTEAEEAGEETDGMAGSVSELREEILSLTKNKVDIMIDDTTFKSTYQIFKELSQVWDSLSDVDTANIIELIGGKRNATAVTSLIKNFDAAEDSLKTASNAAGSAMRENEKWIDSIEGRLSVFQATFQELAGTIIDSEFIKWIIDVGSKILQLINDIINSLGGLGGTLTTVGVIIAGLNFNKIISSITGRAKTIALKICPSYSGGNTKQADSKNGAVGKAV